MKIKIKMTDVQIELTDLTEAEAKSLLPTFSGTFKNPKLTVGGEEVAEPVEAAPAPAPAEPEKQEAPAAEPEKQEAPKATRKDAKSAAVRKIQAGHRDEVKALITAYAASGKIDDIPEEQLGEFTAKVGEIGA